MPATVLWPERESLYELMRLRASIGPAAFASEKQNDPVNPDLCEWPSSYFDHPNFWFKDWPERLTIKTLALDPSKGKDRRDGDYWAYVRLGRAANGVMYCEADLRKGDTEQIVDAGIDHVKEFNPDGFAIEINQFQELFVASFQLASKAAGLVLPIYTIDNMVNKEVRIRRLGPYLAQRLLRFKTRSQGTQLLVQQLRDFPNADHDDGPDSAEGALRLMIDLANKRARGASIGGARGWRA